MHNNSNPWTLDHSIHPWFMAKRQYFDKQQNLSITTWMDRDHWFTTVFQLIPAASPVPSGRNSYDLVSRNSDNQKWETSPKYFLPSSNPLHSWHSIFDECWNWPWRTAWRAGLLPSGLSGAANGLLNLCLSTSPASGFGGTPKALWNLLLLSKLCRILLFTSSFVSAALLLRLELTLEVT